MVSYLNNSKGVTIVMNAAALNAYIRSPQGPILKDTIRRATLVQTAAKKQVRLGHVGGGTRGLKGGGPGAKGNLRDSIVKRVMPGVGDAPPFVRVGSEHPLALLHHNGTKPHIIRPKNAKFLRFPANGGNGGGFVFAKIVHHPGTKPNRYLTDNLHLAGQ